MLDSCPPGAVRWGASNVRGARVAGSVSSLPGFPDLFGGWGLPFPRNMPAIVQQPFKEGCMNANIDARRSAKVG